MQLSKQFNTSRPTVIKALDKLLNLALIYKVQGKGSFVNIDHISTTSQECKIISLVMPFADQRDKGRLDELNIIKGVEKQLGIHGYNLMIHYCKNTATDFFAAMRRVKESVSSGIIVYVAQNLNDFEQICDIFLDNHPIVLLDKSLVGFNLPCVKVNNIKGASLATKHMIGCNYDVICFLSDLDISLNESVRERYLGFRQVQTSMQNNYVFEHLQFNDVDGSLSDSAILSSLKELIDKYPGKRIGLVCVSDFFAQRVYSAVSTLNLSVPSEIGITGFDGVNTLLPNQHKLTSISNDFYAIGNNAASLIFEMVTQKTLVNKSVILDVDLCIGDTTSKR